MFSDRGHKDLFLFSSVDRMIGTKKGVGIEMIRSSFLVSERKKIKIKK